MGKSKSDCDKKMFDEMWNMKAKNPREQLDRAVTGNMGKSQTWDGGEEQGWQSQLVYELHKGVRRKFVRRRIIVNGVDEVWAADLVDMQKIFACCHSRSTVGWFHSETNQLACVTQAFQDIFQSFCGQIREESFTTKI